MSIQIDASEFVVSDARQVVEMTFGHSGHYALNAALDLLEELTKRDDDQKVMNRATFDALAPEQRYECMYAGVKLVDGKFVA